MSDAVLKKVKVPLPVSVDLTGALVVGTRDITEEDYIGTCLRRDGGSFLILELTTGEWIEEFCPFITHVPADYGEPLAPACPAAKDLHTLIMSHVNATPRRLSVFSAKRVLAHFKVARAQDLTNEQALEGKAIVEKMVAAVSDLDRS